MGEVSLAVPAKPEYLHVVRAVVSGMAARQGLTFEDIQDLCLAANEAAGYLLALPGEAHRLGLRMRSGEGLELVVSTDAPATGWPPQLKDSLAWRILSNLVPDVTFSVQDQSPVIRLMVQHPDGSSHA
ncbi:MAG TPA: hypothetical protein VKY26_12545 [Actinomycetota bacterium]|nr:hypothetical protein [Actinomycetota bacterium]